MGGKNDIISSASMSNLFENGYSYISFINESIKNLDQIISELRETSLVGEKGLVCRQALNSISALTNDLTRTTERVAAYMEAKLNINSNNDETKQDLTESKGKYDFVKR